MRLIFDICIKNTLTDDKFSQFIIDITSIGIFRVDTFEKLFQKVSNLARKCYVNEL